MKNALLLALLLFPAATFAHHDKFSIGGGAAILSPNGPALSFRYHYLTKTRAGFYTEVAAIGGDKRAMFINAGITVHTSKSRRTYFFLGVGANTDLLPYQVDRAHYHFGVTRKLGHRWAIEWNHRSTCSNFIGANINKDKCLGFLPKGEKPNQGVDMILIRYSWGQ